VQSRLHVSGRWLFREQGQSERAADAPQAPPQTFGLARFLRCWRPAAAAAAPQHAIYEDKRVGNCVHTTAKIHTRVIQLRQLPL
jgi:hypothetical protein